MHGGDAAPRVRLDTRMPDVIHEMSSKRLGMTCVIANDGRLAGVFTDGDLRRLMMARPPNAVLALTAGEAMTPRPLTIARDMLAVEALRIMETHKITSVVVVDATGMLEGVVHLHDLWRTQAI
jgi:arabinose-5-phosphate isomerase